MFIYIKLKASSHFLNLQRGFILRRYLSIAGFPSEDQYPISIRPNIYYNYCRITKIFDGTMDGNTFQVFMIFTRF